MTEHEIDKTTGLPIVDGNIDLSSGIKISDEDRAALAKAVAEMNEAYAAASKRLAPSLQPVAFAIHTLRVGLPLAASIPGNPIPVPIADALLKAAEDAAKALGI